MRVVRLGPVDWHVAPAGELLRPHAYDISKKWGRIFDILLMAGSKGDITEASTKNIILGGVAWSANANAIFGLWGTAGSLTDASDGGTANEVTGGSYDRVTMTNNTTNFPTVTTAAKVNNVAITFPTASANWNGGANINQVGVFDTNLKTSGDKLQLWGDLTVPKPVLSGDIAQFAIGAFSYTED